MRTRIALVRGISKGFAQALSRTPSAISVEKAAAAQRQYVDLLSKVVPKVIEVEGPADLPDCVFIEDTAVAVGHTVMLTQPGAESRRGEVNGVHQALRSVLPEIDILSMRERNKDATMDGGDVLYTGRHCFVGLSSRTNVAGLEALKELLGPRMPGGKESVIGIEVVDDLHLKCIVTSAGSDQLAVHDSKGGRNFQSTVEKQIGAGHGYGLHFVPTPDAANILRVNDALFVEDTAVNLPEIKKLAAEAGLDPQKVVGIDNAEFNKADGSLTCRSLLLV